jgi:Rhodopirellula transposase DDE domain
VERIRKRDSSAQPSQHDFKLRRRSARKRYREMAPVLDEQSRRLFVALEAQALGRGGVSLMARNLKELVEPATRGDPTQLLLWTCRSLRNLVKDLAQKGHTLSPTVVDDLLRDMGYSLQGNKKYEKVGSISIGMRNFSTSTRRPWRSWLRMNQSSLWTRNGEWRPKGRPETVNDPKLRRAIPYGVYDINNNVGWVSVGTDHDTTSFAVHLRSHLGFTVFPTFWLTRKLSRLHGANAAARPQGTVVNSIDPSKRAGVHGQGLMRLEAAYRCVAWSEPSACDRQSVDAAQNSEGACGAGSGHPHTLLEPVTSLLELLAVAGEIPRRGRRSQRPGDRP